MANLQTTDLIVVGRGGTSYQTTFEDFKDSVFIDSPLGTVEFIDVQDPAPGDAKPGDLFITFTEDEPWSEVCQGVCHTAWIQALEACGGDADCEGATVPEYAMCLQGCDNDLSREQAEVFARRNIRHLRGIDGNGYIVDGGGFADSSFTAFASEFVPNGSYIFVDQDGNWQKAPIPQVDLSVYAKLYNSSQSITAKEFIGDGSKLTNLPVGETVDAYTKVESDANYIRQNISSLPELPTD